MEKQIASNEKTNSRCAFKKKREPFFLFFMIYPEILLIFAREKTLKQTKTERNETCSMRTHGDGSGGAVDQVSSEARGGAQIKKMSTIEDISKK